MKEKLPQALVIAIAQACKVLGIHCVAKRVESQAALDWLEAVGCDFAQGFALEKPLSLESLAAPVPKPSAPSSADEKAGISPGRFIIHDRITAAGVRRRVGGRRRGCQPGRRRCRTAGRRRGRLVRRRRVRPLELPWTDSRPCRCPPA